MDIVETGFPVLDKKEFGGLKRGELTFLYARVGAGKTAFLCNVFVNMIEQMPPVKCIYFTFEETKENVLERLACIKSGVKYCSYFSWNGRTVGQEKKVRETTEWLLREIGGEKAKSNIVNDAETLADAVLAMAEMKTAKGLDAVFIDGLQHWREYAKENTYDMVRVLKEVARRLDVAVLVGDGLPSLRRVKQPALCHISSKSVLRTADKIILLDRPEMIASAEEIERGDVSVHTIELRIVKNNTGLRGFIPLHFDFQTQRIVDLPDDEIPWDE